MFWSCITNLNQFCFILYVLLWTRHICYEMLKNSYQFIWFSNYSIFRDEHFSGFFKYRSKFVQFMNTLYTRASVGGGRIFTFELIEKKLNLKTWHNKRSIMFNWRICYEKFENLWKTRYSELSCLDILYLVVNRRYLVGFLFLWVATWHLGVFFKFQKLCIHMHVSVIRG